MRTSFIVIYQLFNNDFSVRSMSLSKHGPADLTVQQFRWSIKVSLLSYTSAVEQWPTSRWDRFRRESTKSADLTIRQIRWPVKVSLLGRCGGDYGDRLGRPDLDPILADQPNRSRNGSNTDTQSAVQYSSAAECNPNGRKKRASLWSEETLFTCGILI